MLIALFWDIIKDYWPQLHQSDPGLKRYDSLESNWGWTSDVINILVRIKLKSFEDFVYLFHLQSLRPELTKFQCKFVLRLFSNSLNNISERAYILTMLKMVDLKVT